MFVLSRYLPVLYEIIKYTSEVSLQQEEQYQDNNIKGCILPWIHLHGNILGEYKVCCFADYVPDTQVLGIHTDDITDVWNNASYKKIRKSFIQGQVPLQCAQACYNKEATGNISSREISNKKYAQYASLQKNTNSEGLVSHTPTYLDIRFGNLCNFKCRTCGPDASTSWYKEYPDFPHKKAIDNYTNNVIFWNSLATIAASIEHVYFAGGEPFVQDGHYKLLEYLIKNNYAKDIELTYNTNLSYSKYKNHDLQSLWSNFKSVSLWPSIDGYGKKAEYTRSGLSWDTFEKNTITFADRITTLSAVISIYSITSMPNLILWCKKYNLSFNGTTLLNPSHQSVTCLPLATKNKITALYTAFISNYANLLESYEISDINDWVSYMNSKDDSDKLLEFKQYNDKLDKNRKESFMEIFPEYASWYSAI
tara:strand:+ start:5163 stop:6428 length:1266 start_codon:yes stop_codon:yes gene_type:complete